MKLCDHYSEINLFIACTHSPNSLPAVLQSGAHTQLNELASLFDLLRKPLQNFMNRP